MFSWWVASASCFVEVEVEAPLKLQSDKDKKLRTNDAAHLSPTWKPPARVRLNVLWPYVWILGLRSEVRNGMDKLDRLL